MNCTKFIISRHTPVCGHFAVNVINHFSPKGFHRFHRSFAYGSAKISYSTKSRFIIMRKAIFYKRVFENRDGRRQSGLPYRRHSLSGRVRVGPHDLKIEKIQKFNKIIIINSMLTNIIYMFFFFSYLTVKIRIFSSFRRLLFE